LKVAKTRYESWKKNIGTQWPYAEALYFYEVAGKKMTFSSDYSKYESHGSIDKFIKIFDNTLFPDDAYAAMRKI
jgi:hypothetical protein